jgi:hypothetical protein
MPAVSISPQPKLQFFDANGNPLAGGKLYTYAAGTTTPLASYTDSTGNVANTNPVVLDSRGEASVWLAGAQYKLALYTAANVLVWTVDGVNGADQATLATLAASGGSALVGFLQAGTGAIARTAQSKMRDVVSVLDFGAVGDGVADDTAAIQAAIDYVAGIGGGIVLGGNGKTYRITAPLRQKTGVYFNGSGCTIVQATANTALWQPIAGTSVQRWGISNVVHSYASAASATDTNSGLWLANGGLSYDWVVENIRINDACDSIICPSSSGSFAFVGTLSQIVSDKHARWALNLDCDSGAGANTNITMVNVWSLQTAGSPKANSRGFRINGLSMANIMSLFADYPQGPVFEFTNVWGYGGMLSCEAGTFVANNTQVSVCNFSECSLTISALLFVSNSFTTTGTGEIYLVRPTSGSSRSISIDQYITENNSYSGGAIYEVVPVACRIINRFAKLDRTASLADFGAVPLVELWNGSPRVGRGTTAQRPTLTSLTQGYLYLDNTLDADGKPIWWNGSAWVDATGAIV